MSPLLNDNMEGNKAAQLRQDFDGTFAMPASLASQEVEDLILVRVAGDPYAIRLIDIAEIVTECKVVSVPAVTPDLLGLAGIHGGMVVFSLSSVLGYAPDPGSPRWMILCGTEEPIALAFSDFEGYVRLPASALYVDENMSTAREHMKYVNQVASTPDGIRAVISIAQIMATIRNRISLHRPTKEK